MNRFIAPLFIVYSSFVSALYTISASAEPLYSFTAHEVASLKWGTGTGQVALTKVPANNFGPPSLAVNNTGTSFYLLDSANQRIAVIKNNQFSSIPLSANGADDFCLSNNNHFHLLFNDKVVQYNQTGQIIKTYPIKNDIMPISIQCPLILEGFDGLFYSHNKNEPLQFIPIGQYAFSVEQNDGSQWMIHRQDNKTGVRRNIAIDNRFGSIETLNIIGVDKKGNIYLTVEEMLHNDHADEKVFRLLRKYTPFGELVAETELPYSLYAYTLKDLVVTPLGEVFQMLPFPDSLKIIKWQQTGYSKTFAKDNLTQWLYVGEPDDFEPSETLADEAALDETAQLEKPQTTKGWRNNITRRQVIKKARKYVRYRFRVKKSNITKGVYDHKKKLVITPISKRGRYTGMPYKWGGNDTLSSFKRGLSVQPAAHDAGTALGAAFFIWNHILDNEERQPMTHAYLGPSFTDSEIEKELQAHQLSYKRTDQIEREVAELISQNNIVGFFQGRMEIGPRALGNRSLLADPRHPDMRGILNRKVKHREYFRPLAPSILYEEAKNWFHIKKETSAADFMLMAYPVKESVKEKIPAVVHVDGTSRIQAVKKETNPRYHKLISEFYQISGVPIVLNTSFNDSEPIVGTPKNAINTFLKTEIDYLALGNFIVSKADNR